MAMYGYKVSGLSRSERYFETEKLLDKKLKDYEKLNSSFEEDGSRKQIYRKTAEDGTISEVTLIKNVTESGIMVFSDRELKFLKFGGAYMYLRDIPAVVIFCLLYYRAAEYFVSPKIAPNISSLVLNIAVCIAAVVIISILTYNLLNTDRYHLRIRIIQSGFPITLILPLYWFVKLINRYPPMALWYEISHSAFLPVIIGTILSGLILKNSRRN